MDAALWTTLRGGLKPHGFRRKKKTVRKLRAKTPIRRVTRPKPISEKRRRDSAEYERKKRIFLREHPFCGCSECSKRSKDLHHSRGRAGPLYLDERYWLALCREHHDVCRDDPDRARKLGILCAKGKWGRSE